MTKEEKIKEAWDFIWNRLNETAKQCALKNNGYVSGILANELYQPFTEWNEELKAWRPKSLQGIENNNGWIKIKSQDDLPKDGWHWTLSIIENPPFQTHYEDIDIRYHTHYQPIEKPEPPLY